MVLFEVTSQSSIKAASINVSGDAVAILSGYLG